VNRRFGGAYHHHLQGKKLAEQETSETSVHILTTWQCIPEGGNIQDEPKFTVLKDKERNKIKGLKDEQSKEMILTAFQDCMLQGYLLGKGPKLIIINHAIIYG
jgi:hypothetical protein